MFINNRNTNLYYSQLNTFNSLIIQRRGGFSSIKYAIMNNIIIFDEYDTVNSTMLKKDFNVQVLKLSEINKTYNQKKLSEIARKNKINMIQYLEKTKKFWIILFSKKSSNLKKFISS